MRHNIDTYIQIAEWDDRAAGALQQELQGGREYNLSQHRRVSGRIDFSEEIS